MLKVRIVTVLTAVFLALASTLTLSSAQADDHGCWAGPLGTNGTEARCLKLGIGQRFRAVVKCDGFFKDYYRYGRWITNRNEPSIIYCDNSRTRSKGHSYQLQTST